MAKPRTIVLALYFVILAGEVLMQSQDMCVSNSTCLQRKECFDFLNERNVSRDGFFFSCSDSGDRVCCPVEPGERGPKLNEGDSQHLLPQTTCGISAEHRIIGGQPAFIGQFPWIAILAYRANSSSEAVDYRCGGTLINNRYVLTAAHCLQYGEPVYVRLGELDLSQERDCEEDYDYCADPPVDMEVEKMTSHPEYNQPFLKNDIALLRLKENVSRTEFISPICLPFGINITGEERKKTFTVAGWGRVHNQNYTGSNILLHTKVTNVPVSKCNKTQPRDVRPIGALQLCAGDKGLHDVCKGDSGGPLMDVKLDNQGQIRTYQVGIVSFGFGACGENIPSVYTRVSAYLPWILSHLEP